MAGIFISYRNVHRSYAPMLIDRELRRRFGPDSVFQAARSNLPATAFPEAIMRQLGQCTLLIALIDRPWAGEDLGLLHNPADWVRREISYALQNGKQILPVLLDGVSMPSARALPDDVAPLTHRIAVRMAARTADADLLRLLGEVERLAPGLVLTGLTDPPLPPPSHPPALLRAEYETVGFRPRPELDQLTAWCADPAGPPAQLVTGPGGAGKTRLGLRLCARLRGLGWTAGLLSESVPAPALDRLGELGPSGLVVIDDAETRPRQVQAALRSLAGAPGAPGRLLLLARAGGDWLDQLREDDDDRVAALLDGIVPVPLEPLRLADGDFAAVCADYARRLNLPVPPPAAGNDAPATMLELQAAVVAHLVPSGSRAGPPLLRVLELERNYWRRAAASFGLESLSRRNLAEIMTAVTLIGASTEPEADALIASLRTFRDGPVSAVDRCRDLLRTVLPGAAPLNPLQPEQLGEQAVAEFLRSGLPLPDPAELTDEQVGRALTGLGRCLEHHPDVGEQVTAYLADPPRRLLPLAMTALRALPQPDLMADRMHQVLGRVPAGDLAGLVAALPQRSEALARFAVAVTERALTAARQAGSGDLTTARLARLLATRLAYLRERPADAIAAAQAAVSQLTALAGTGQEPRAELAEAHAALALALDMDMDQQAGALAAGALAVAAYRALPGGDRRDSALATALNNQSIRQQRAGHIQSALDLTTEAGELAGPLQRRRPARFRSLYADVLDTRSMLLEQAGQAAQAAQAGRDALDLRRALAAARPDAYRPQLAATLHNLGLILSGHGGDPGEIAAHWAQAAAIYDDLAARQPGRFDAPRELVRRHRDGLRAAARD